MTPPKLVILGIKYAVAFMGFVMCNSCQYVASRECFDKPIMALRTGGIYVKQPVVGVGVVVAVTEHTHRIMAMAFRFII